MAELVRPELRDKLAELSPEHRRLFLERLDRLKKTAAESAGGEIRRRRGHGRLPVSFSQLRQWILDRFEPGTPAYNLFSPLRLGGPLDAAALRRSASEIVRRHESLRTVFAETGGEPRQVIFPGPLGEPLAAVDLGVLPVSARRREGERQGRLEAARPFDLTRGPLVRLVLVRLSSAEHLFFVTFHHMVSDGWSLGVFYRELDALYRHYASGGAGARPLPELEIQYADFAAWQRQWLRGETLERMVDYWRRQLAGAPPVLDLPADRPRPAVRTSGGGQRPVYLPAAVTGPLKALALEERASVFMALLAGLKTLLYRVTGQGDLTVGTYIANRNRSETADLIGFFVNTLALRARLDGALSARRALGRIRDTALAAYAHQDLPFEKLLDVLAPERDPAYTPLFQVLLVLHNTPDARPRLGGLEAAYLDGGGHRAEYDLELSLAESGEAAAGCVTYSADLFDASSVDRLLRHWRILLAAMAADPDGRLSALPYLSPAERHQVLREWSGAGRGPGGRRGAPETVHRLFERQAARTPEHPAVVAERGSLTYRELDEGSNRLARALRDRGAGPESVVGLACRRSLQRSIALLGVLKAGAAYLPLDPEHPAERLGFQVRDAGVRLLLADDPAAPLGVPGVDVVGLDDLVGESASRSSESLENDAGRGHLAYVLYTSGSTGRPKGVMVPHGCLARFAGAAVSQYGIVPGDRILQFAALTFDTSVEEIFPCLIRGATLVLRRDERVQAPEALLGDVAEHGLTVLDLPTAYWHELASVPGLRLPGSIRLVILGGEKASRADLETWRRQASPRVRLVNTYGPTEATVVATACDVDGPTLWPRREIPIGRPLPGARARVLDGALRPAAAGVRGELAIGGAGVARGYLGRPGLTAERFVPDSFSAEPGERLYRTGDLARRRGDGQLEFEGRLDDQVKLRGLRVEPGEIAAALARHPAVERAAVVARPLPSGERGLVAYIVKAAGDAPPAAELRRFLRQSLPAFMVPAVFVELASLPFTPSNKVDRAALARAPLPGPLSEPRSEPRSGPDTDEAGGAAPKSETERRLAAIWRDVLGLERVGTDDNFFDLGGDSLLILRLHRRIVEDLGASHRVLDLFRFPTVRSFAVHLGEDGARPDFEKARGLVARRKEARRRRRPGPMTGRKRHPP